VRQRADAARASKDAQGGLRLAEDEEALWAEELDEGTPCPSCGEPVPEGAALCTSCGLNLESGRRQMTKVRAGVAHEAEEIRSWVSGVSLILPFAIVPYRTTEAGEKPRWANVTLVILTVLTSIVALVMLLGDNLEPLRYALWSGPRFAPQQLVTHLFLHGGLAHLVGNMIFLWVFGSAINRALGSAWYPATYVALGMLAGYCGHVLPAEPGTEVPLIGASGAISALSGLYLVLFPRHDIHMAVWFRLAWWMRPWIKTFAVTGVFAVLFYVAFDVAAVTLGWTGNVAHWVHLSGFLWGILLGLALLFTGAVRSEGYDLLTWLMGDRWKRLFGRA
jgi:membrane associated rhomboid family serine protease